MQMGSSTESKSKVTNEEEEVYSHAMVLGSAIVLPTVFQAVVNLDVLDIIDKAGPGAELSASEIASQIPTKNPEGAAKMLDRVLGLLVSFNILCCSFSTHGVRLYSLAPVAKYYVTDQNGVSMRPYMNLSLDKVMMPGWYVRSSFTFLFFFVLLNNTLNSLLEFNFIILILLYLKFL